MTRFPLIPGLSNLADQYDCYIIDLWGVMHDGVTAFPAALDCLRELKGRGARVIILSNAPRRASEVEARNSELGIEKELVDLVMSSGELTWQHLKTRRDPFYRRLGTRCFHLGPDRDHGMRDGLGLTFTQRLTEADFILLTGPREQKDEVEDYLALLTEARDLGLPMICANPDYVVVRGGKREICAGALGLKYAELGGELRYQGKPDREIYDLCFERLNVSDRGRVLAVGDSLRTDVQGAKGAGVDALFIAGGIHGEELGMTDGKAPDAQKLAAMIAAAPARPDAVMTKLFW